MLPIPTADVVLMDWTAAPSENTSQVYSCCRQKTTGSYSMFIWQDHII